MYNVYIFCVEKTRQRYKECDKDMINFEEEVSKYKPILNIDEVESSIQSDEIKDMMDLLQYITDQASGRRRKGKI